MDTVTIPKKEYKNLVEKNLRYEYLRSVFERDLFNPPPLKSRKAVLAAFGSTGKYSKKFLSSIEGGLKRSSYFRA